MIRAHRAAVVARLAPWRVIDDRAKVDDSSMPSPWVVVDFPPPLKETDRWSAPDQHRGVGEPAILAGLAQLLAAEFAIDPGRVFDRTLPLDDAAAGYAAMSAREALKVALTT